MKTEKVRGFSLIELMVSLTIFSLVMTTGVGTLLVLIDANAKAQALYSAMTDLSFALDTITRNIRTGREYYCASAESMETEVPNAVNGGPTQDCTSGDTAIAFTRNVDNERVAYRLNSTTNRIEQAKGNPSSPQWVAITSANTTEGLMVSIQKFEITVRGTDPAFGASNFEQPKVSLLIAGEVTNGLDTPTTFRLQSNVTPRILDY